MRSARLRAGALGALLLAMGAYAASAQSASATNSLTSALQAIAGRYPVRDIEFFGRDSVLGRADLEGPWVGDRPPTQASS